MFRELAQLGSALDANGALPPPCYYDYAGKPVKWVVHLYADRAYVEQVDDWYCPRPYNGRSSDVQAHFLADEAGYALGVGRGSKGTDDKRAGKKHRAFVDLTQHLRTECNDAALNDAIDLLLGALADGRIARADRFSAIASEEWVSFMPEVGPLAGRHLFQHPVAIALWRDEMERRCIAVRGEKDAIPVIGPCAACGATKPLVRRLPLDAKLAGTAPLHSLNAPAFASYVSGGNPEKKAHLGLCFDCGDRATRAFNHLIDDERHHLPVVRDRKARDKLSNQTAIFWIKTPTSAMPPLEAGEIDLFAVLSDPELTRAVIGADRPPAPALGQAVALLRQPWSPSPAALRLDEAAFHLAVLSPNVGRIALRDWFAVGLGPLQQRLAAFLEGTMMVRANGAEPMPVSIAALTAAMGGTDPNLPRELLRTAYLGARPPASLASRAGQRLNHLIAHEKSLRERQRTRARDRPPIFAEHWTHALAGAIKLAGFYGTEEAIQMSEVDELQMRPAYLAGRLLALLESAQKRYQRDQTGKWPETTGVLRAYGGACAAPRATIGALLVNATTAHLPKLDDRINRRVEDVMAILADVGGLPTSLTVAQQADFGIGFYQQRAALRKGSGEDDTTAASSTDEATGEDESEPVAEQG